MKINLYHDSTLTENRVDLFYGELDAETTAMKEYLSTFQKSIRGWDDEHERERIILPNEILYFEIVDRKSYVYLADSVWRTDYGLQQFLDIFEPQGFTRISKSMLVNIYHVSELKAELNMRVHIKLDNKESVVLNRGYRTAFYTYLKRKVAEA